MGEGTDLAIGADSGGGGGGGDHFATHVAGKGI